MRGHGVSKGMKLEPRAWAWQEQVGV